ncbi:hypothetical protein A1O1_08292 [Capronia coronata CBS 617.96]|uniref:Carrier domain-containing protein n=1 Tax=Capronia coronata CBS 617.96 TaxID=1182541 RepID=W9XS28_9EURO|nr:uncharacterized protein A1O1_08292 [Capronia coronata CBS 617.96]EXJ80150.1 hypothetical protein A1O1_08292 [Capronia coronata CBS 617.96]
MPNGVMTTEVNGSHPTMKDSRDLITSSLLPTPPHDDEEMMIHTIDDVLVERCSSIPDQPLVGYPASSHSAEDYVYYTAKDLDRFANGAIDDLVKQGFQQASGVGSKTKVVAILGVTNLDYIVSIFALSRLGCAVLFLSTRLSAEAYLNLLDKTECHEILCCSSTEKVALSIQKQRPINLYMIPGFSSYGHCGSNSDLILRGTPNASKETAFIIHSSGSTGLPKPIFQSHKACISNYAVSKGYRALLTLPLYHNHGLSTFFRAIFKGKQIALYNASLPLTGGNLLRGLKAVEPESFHSVPYALKLLCEVDGGVAALATCKQVLFGGSSCPDEIGDKLVEGGVNLISHYGATEMGQLMTSERPVGDKAWNYVRPLPNVASYLFFDPLEDGSFECVVLDGLPAKVTSNSDNPPNSFRTSDCFTKHPTILNAWKYLGRIDDRVTLMNGEKVLPIPIEHAIRQSKFVKDVLVVGVGRLLPGLIIVPSDEAQGLDKSQILAAVWPLIEAANRSAEAFSQISKDMVEILDIGTTYPSTDKGTMIRQGCYKHFSAIIDAMYARQESGEAPSGRKLALSIPGIEDFLLSLMRQELGFDEITVDTDFYEAGMDSLQAIKAQSVVKRELDLGNGALGQNAFFDFANIKKLAAHLYGLRTGHHGEEENEIDVMAELIEKYSTFKKSTPTNADVIIITGVTGSLGAYVLSQLMQKESVRRIVCLVRASSPDAAFDRVVATLSAKSLPLTNLSKIRVYPSDLSKPDLGLGGEVVEGLLNTLTKVIHIAWAVNFNIGVRSFEQQHIRGVHNLINLCLSRRGSPAQFYFCSSISAAAGTPLPARISEGPIPELSHAQKMGYARSKLVAERVIQAAAEKTGMVAKVLRVGQIVGDTVTGQWNPTEAIPLMIQSAVTMKALPALDETPSWTPVDIVAQAVLELCGLGTSDKATAYASDPKTVYHVQNPRTFHWTTDLLPALQAAGLDFEVVSQREWIKRLREGEQDPKKNPTVKLVDFYADKYDNDRMSRKGLVFEMHKTEEASPALRGGVELISSGLIKKYVDAWLKVWREG